MSPEERAEHCRRIARLGGQAVVAKHGIEHMSLIGKAGFQSALDLGYGEVLARKLGPAYEAKFGKPLVLGAASAEKNRLRAQARAIYGGQTCDAAGCELPGDVHHLGGLALPSANEPSNIQVLCKAHHLAWHRARRAAHKQQ